MRVRTWMLSLLAGVLLSGSANDAMAFCRTTNCQCASPGTCGSDCPLDADGCPAKGDRLSWSARCVGYSVDVEGTATLTPEQWTTAIQQAFETWASADCGAGNPPSIDLFPLRDVPCKGAAYDPAGPNANVVYFQDTGWTEGNAIDGTLALTTLGYSTGSTHIGSATIALDSSAHRFTVGDAGVQIDLVSVVMHEVGHFLGIAHSADPTAVMYPLYSAGTLRRSLSADDVAAICTIYPPNRAAETCDPTPPGGLSACDGTDATQRGCATSRAGSSETRDAGSMMVIVAVLGGVAARRRSRR